MHDIVQFNVSTCDVMLSKGFTYSFTCKVHEKNNNIILLFIFLHPTTFHTSIKHVLLRSFLMVELLTVGWQSQ